MFSLMGPLKTFLFYENMVSKKLDLLYNFKFFFYTYTYNTYMCNGLPCDGPGFNSRSERCIYRASRPSEGTVNGGAVSK